MRHAFSLTACLACGTLAAMHPDRYTLGSLAVALLASVATLLWDVADDPHDGVPPAIREAMFPDDDL